MARHGISILILCCLSTGAIARERSVMELVDAYEASLAATKGFELDVRSEVYQLGGDYTTETCTSVTSAICRYDGKRWKFEKTSVKTGHKSETLVRDDTSTDVDFGGKELRIVARLQGANSQQHGAWTRLGEAKILLGFGPPSETPYLPDFFRKHPPEVEMQTLDGKHTHLLSARSPLGEHRLWLDPAAGFTLCKLQVSKQGGDTHMGKLVSDIKMPRPFPTGNLVGYSYDVDQVRTVRHGNHYVIVGLESRSTHNYPGGGSFVIRQVVSIKNERLSPKFTEQDFSITMPIPNGTKVYTLDVPNIDHEWRDGKIVKVVNEELVKGLEGREYKGLFGSGVSGWAILFCAVNVAIFGGLGWWYLKKQARTR